MGKRKRKKMGAAKAAAAKVLDRTEPERPDVGKDKKRATLIDRLDKRRATGGMWKPVVDGDTIDGKVLKLETGKGKYREKQLTVILATPDGDTIRIFANDSLEREVSERGIKAGDYIGIQYKGTVNTGKGRPFKLFVVEKL